MRLRTYLSAHNTEHQLRRIMAFLGDEVKYIADDVRNANRASLDTFNTSGEQQLEIDVAADQRIEKDLQEEVSFGVLELASEEGDTIHDMHTTLPYPTREGSIPRYSVTVDPLDGSSLITPNLAVGTIFGIHEGLLSDFKPARESIVAAMYVQYGPATTMIVTTKGNGVHEFALDRANIWVKKSRKSLTFETGRKLCGFGGTEFDWIPEHKEYVAQLRSEGYKQRNSGGFVPDINQILLNKGSVFAYPSTTKSPNGKLRLLFEGQPMAFISEQAGGAATNGIENILDLIPTHKDERTPIYIGGKYEVELAKKFYK